MSWTLAGFIAFLLAAIAYVVYNIRKGALDDANALAQEERNKALEAQALAEAEKRAKEDKTIADKIIKSGSGSDAGEFMRDSWTKDAN